jgi:hypothetical protein
VTELVGHGLAAAQKGRLHGSALPDRPGGKRTELAAGKLPAVGGVGVGRDGTVYVSEAAIVTNRGQVVASRP